MAALQACSNASEESNIDITQQRLVGSWLRDYQDGEIKARRLLVLQADGRFTESVRVVDANGAVTQHAHEGGWLYDGTNLKRKYTLIDGKQPSAPFVPFATFELKFESNREFVGLDRVHKNEVRYRRVDEGAMP